MVVTMVTNILVATKTLVCMQDHTHSCNSTRHLLCPHTPGYTFIHAVEETAAAVFLFSLFQNLLTHIVLLMYDSVCHGIGVFASHLVLM